MTIADYVDSLVGDIENAAVENMFIVGRSMAGVMLPAVIAKLGPLECMK
jgi:hypothetical protein